MKWLTLAAFFLLPAVASAQTYLGCSGSSCPARYYWETDVPTTRAAPSAAPVDGTVGSGMKLNLVKGAWVELCAATGQTLGGAGTLEAYYYDPAVGLPWMRNPDLDLTVDLSATSCGGSPCRCRIWLDLPSGAIKPGYFLYATNGITVSGGLLTARIGGAL